MIRGNTVRLAIVFEGVLIAVAWAMGWALETPLSGRVFLRWEDLGWGAMATVPPLLAMLACTRLPWKALRCLMKEVDENIIPLFSRASSLQLILLSLLAGIGEEALFRGVLLGWLGSLMNCWVALGITSVLFGLGHLITSTYAFLAALLGLYMGALVLAYDNVLVAMVTHALYDYVALIYLLRRSRAMD